MEIVYVVVLIGLGLGLILVEFVWIPGTTVVGFVGFFMSLAGVYLGYRYFGTTTGHCVLGGVTVFVGLSLWIAIKTKAWKRFALSKQITGRVKLVGQEYLQFGQEGTTTSALRPSGHVEFNDKVFEVSTLGGFIDAGSKVTIVKLDRNQILVDKVNQ